MARDFGITNFQRAAAAPANPAVGDTYYDTTSGKPFYFDGTLWQPFSAGGVAQAIATLNFQVTANTAVTNTANGTPLPLTANEQQGSDLSIVGNTLQANAAGTYHVVFNLTMTSNAACWFILNAWFGAPGTTRKMVVGACVATPWFDEATISFNWTAAAGDSITFAVQTSIASGGTADARSYGSATKVAVGPGPQGPQGPPGVSGDSYLGSPQGIIVSGAGVNTPTVGQVLPFATIFAGNPAYLSGGNTIVIPTSLGGLYDVRCHVFIQNANGIAVPNVRITDNTGGETGMNFAWSAGSWSGVYNFIGSWIVSYQPGGSLQVRYGTTGGPSIVTVSRLSFIRIADALATS